VNEIPVIIGLDIPVSASPVWLGKYLSTARGYVTGHAQYSKYLSEILNSRQYKVIQIFRHPAAVLVSWAHYIIQPGYYWSEVHNRMTKISFEERLRIMIQGGRLDEIIYPAMDEILLRAAGWLKNQNTFIVRFEDLVGCRGGGSDELQRNTINAILDFSGISMTESEKDRIQTSLFGGTHTFREGQINAWRKYVDAEKLELMKITLSNTDIVKKLNYSFD